MKKKGGPLTEPSPIPEPVTNNEVKKIISPNEKEWRSSE